MVATVLDDFPTPPCAVLLGTRVVEARPRDGWVRMAFDGRAEFCNPAGYIQGGFLAAMLDDAMGPAALIMTGGSTFTATIDMTVSFLAPAKPGPIFAEAQVVQLGKSVGFLEGRLLDADGAVLARATASARLVSTAKLTG